MPFSPVRSRLAVLVAALLVVACGDDGTKPQPVTVSLSASSVTIEELETVQLSADLDGPGGEVVTWTSSDEAVATVDGQGRVTGVAAGTAAVTARVTGPNDSAEASATVTVTPLPLAITVDRYVDGGGTVPPDRLGLGVSAQVVYDVPANFEGFIEIRTGGEVLGRISFPEESRKSLMPAGEVVVTGSAIARRGREASLPVSVTAFRDGSIEPLVANAVPTDLVAVIHGSSGASASSAASTVSFAVPSFIGITSIEASRTGVDPLGRSWVGGPAPLVSLNGQMVDFSAVPRDLSGDVSIDIIAGENATTLYGASGAGGVLLIEIGGELADREGEFRFGAQATWSGATDPIPVLNAADIGAGDFELPEGFFYDGAAPAFPDVTLPDDVWLQPGEAWPQLSERFGLRWSTDGFGPATIVDGGIGGATAELRGGTTPELEFGSVEEFDDAYLALAAGWLLGIDVRDDLDNFRRSILSTPLGAPVRFGVDGVAPGAPVFTTGPSFTLPGAVNPASPFFGWGAEDPQPGSGIDPNGYRLSFEWGSPLGGACLIGFGAECAPERAPAGAQNGWAPDGVPTGISAEFRLGVAATDFATNLGEISYADWILDAAGIQASGTPVLGPPADGDIPVTGFTLTDELEVAGTAVVAQYSMGMEVPVNPIYLSSAQVGTPFDGTFETSAQMAQMPHLSSLESTGEAFPNSPSGVIYPLSAVTVVGFDHAGHAGSVSTTAPGVAPRTTSFGVGGMDRFGFRTAPGTICNPTPSNGANCNGAPTSVDITVEAFTSGQFELAQIMLVGAQTDPGNPIPVGDWTDLTVMDQGSFREGTATFTLHGAALQLSGGFLDLWAIGWDANGGGIVSQKMRYATRF